MRVQPRGYLGQECVYKLRLPTIDFILQIEHFSARAAEVPCFIPPHANIYRKRIFSGCADEPFRSIRQGFKDKAVVDKIDSNGAPFGGVTLQ